MNLNKLQIVFGSFITTIQHTSHCFLLACFLTFVLFLAMTSQLFVFAFKLEFELSFGMLVSEYAPPIWQRQVSIFHLLLTHLLGETESTNSCEFMSRICCCFENWISKLLNELILDTQIRGKNLVSWLHVKKWQYYLINWLNWVQFGANSKPTWFNNGSVIFAFVIVLLRGFVVSLNCEQSKHILFDIYWMEIMAKINYQVWHPMPHTHNYYWWSANREQWNVHIEIEKTNRNKSNLCEPSPTP